MLSPIASHPQLVPQALQDPRPRPNPSLLLQEEHKGGASYAAGEPPRVGCCCTLRHWPTAALAQPIELLEHLLQTRLHSFDGAYGSICAHYSYWLWSGTQAVLSVHGCLPLTLQSSRSPDLSSGLTEPSLH
jgi:hypothetical protein